MSQKLLKSAAGQSDAVNKYQSAIPVLKVGC